MAIIETAISIIHRTMYVVSNWDIVFDLLFFLLDGTRFSLVRQGKGKKVAFVFCVLQCQGK